MTWLWIGGWGVPPEWHELQAAAVFPHAKHRAVPPDPAGRWREERSCYDRVIGYSLGAFLLLEAEQESPCDRPVALLAPFFAFPAEAGLGGKVALTRLRYLQRWFRREPEAALHDFYRRAGLPELGEHGDLPYPLEILFAGLDTLKNGRLAPRIPTGALAFAGKDDTLLDASRLNALCPEIRVLADAGHHPDSLVRALAGIWPGCLENNEGASPP
jgi:hypothetical protein